MISPSDAKKDCFYCQGKKNPSYKEYQDLGKFVSGRAKIVSGVRSGICAKHQRILSREVKRARHLGLLPFTVSI